MCCNKDKLTQGLSPVAKFREKPKFLLNQLGSLLLTLNELLELDFQGLGFLGFLHGLFSATSAEEGFCALLLSGMTIQTQLGGGRFNGVQALLLTMKGQNLLTRSVDES